LPQGTLKSLRENLLVEWTYHSNSIEGNTLTLKETKVVLEGITVGGKTLKEHLEAINHKEAIIYVEATIKDHEPFSEWQIKNIHAIILKGIDPENAGTYRKENVLIAGARHIPPDYLAVPDQMQEMIKWYDSEASNLHPLIRAANVHNKLVSIHPFVDGNGRTARLMLNLELMKAGYPPIIIRNEDRLTYYDALELSQCEENNEPFLALVTERTIAALDLYLKLTN
ncbi:MAG: Fic family protein, partial [bacterium]|nr:Fic family protein [bacterium]